MVPLDNNFHFFVTENWLKSFYSLAVFFSFQNFFFIFWLCWVFTAAHRFFLVVASGSSSLVAVVGLLSVVASLVVEYRLQGVWASVVGARGLSSCGAWVQLPLGMWNLPTSRIEHCVTYKWLLNHWTTREVLWSFLLFCGILFFVLCFKFFLFFLLHFMRILSFSGICVQCSF